MTDLQIWLDIDQAYDANTCQGCVHNVAGFCQAVNGPRGNRPRVDLALDYKCFGTLKERAPVHNYQTLITRLKEKMK